MCIQIIYLHFNEVICAFVGGGVYSFVHFSVVCVLGIRAFWWNVQVYTYTHIYMYMCKIILSAKTNNLTLFVNLVAFYLFLFLIVLARISSPCHIPILREKTFHFFPFSMMWLVDLSHMNFIVHNLLFLAFIEMILWVLTFIPLMWCITFNDLCMLKTFLYPEINPTLS